MFYDLRETLQRVPIFSGLSTTALTTLAEHASTKTYTKNSIVISEGETGDALYIIASGKVRICLSDEGGKEVCLGTEAAGQCFGEYALLDESPRSATVITESKSVFVVISRRNFNQWLDENPKASLSIMKELVAKIRDLTENVKILALCDVYGRLVKVMMSMAVQEGDNYVIQTKPTQQELANRIGSSREMVSKIFKELSKGGYIELDSNQVIIRKQLPKAW
ncbi:MAG: Crp/Fnr family transcriptional regulator [Gammaproteobacteria bacterium]|nr:Crp/Fnr family transcriptional regulator [Gammaproteobacteria bacterium]